MMRKSSSRVSISPDATEKPTISLTPNYIYARATKTQNHVPRSLKSRFVRKAHVSVVKFFRRVGANAKTAFCFISKRRSSSATATSSTHQNFAPPRDSHQSEAIEDCIKFINSSSRKYN
uniref:Josephin-like protein n=1 Tax=Ananas comosus var. bracteatus TaxID=296719 RepID=A0A6V7NGV4_ANACO|nr:unnamed protein product [Ananas comosus var. bracteatus]